MSLGGIVKPWPPMQTLTTDRKFRIGCNVNAGRRWSGIRNFGNGALGHVAVSSVRDSVFIEKAAPLPMRPLLSDSPTSHTACEAALHCVSNARCAFGRPAVYCFLSIIGCKKFFTSEANVSRNPISHLFGTAPAFSKINGRMLAFACSPCAVFAGVRLIWDSSFSARLNKRFAGLVVGEFTVPVGIGIKARQIPRYRPGIINTVADELLLG
jgi:hypothetical protein